MRADCVLRLECADITETEGILWTLGTNWRYTPENYENLRRAYRLFSMRLHRNYPVNIHFRVFEMGSKGGRLHVHFVSDLSRARIPHSVVKKYWQEATGDPDAHKHVNFARRVICGDCNKMQNYYSGRYKRVRCNKCKGNSLGPLPIRRALLYIMKYLTKASAGLLKRNYYWGKTLFYKWTLIDNSVQLDFDGNKNGYVLYRSQDGYSHKLIRYYNLMGKSGEVRILYKDRHIECTLEECNNRLLIKALEFEDHPSLYEKLQNDILVKRVYSVKFNSEIQSVDMSVYTISQNNNGYDQRRLDDFP